MTTEVNWKQQCVKLLKALAKSKNASPFREPVDTLKYEDYLKKIGGNPMDLRTIQEKLHNDAYATPFDFSKDIRLIFSNSEKYNDDRRTKLYKTTLQFIRDFEKTNMHEILYLFNSGKTEVTGKVGLRGIKRNITGDRELEEDESSICSSNESSDESTSLQQSERPPNHKRKKERTEANQYKTHALKSLQLIYKFIKDSC